MGLKGVMQAVIESVESKRSQAKQPIIELADRSATLGRVNDDADFSASGLVKKATSR